MKESIQSNDKNHCDTNHDDGQCICNKNFSGINCHISNQCLSSSIEKCYNNGYFVTKTNDITKCDETKCSCLLPWSGNKCNICTTQCFNGGKLYQTCKCGCSSGYNGDQCQCQSLIGNIMIYGSSSIFSQYYYEYNNKNVVADDDGNDDIEYNNNLYIAYQTLYKKLLNDFELALNIPSKSIRIIMTHTLNPNWKDDNHDDDNNNNNNNNNTNNQNDDNENIGGNDMNYVKYNTKFQFIFTYGCEEYNPTLTTDMINDKWSSFGTKITQLSTIQQYFQLSSLESIVENLQPIPDSLPTFKDEYIPIDDEVNSVMKFQTTFIITASIIISIITHYFVH